MVLARNAYFAGALAALGMAGFCLAPAQAGDETGFSNVPTAELLETNGVWRSRGYGWWWRVSEGRLARFDATETVCDPKRSRSDLPGSFADTMKRSDDGRTVRLAIGDPTYLYTFDRVEALPSSCSEERPRTPAAVFEAVVSIFDTHYPFFEQRGIDWDAAVAARRASIDPEMSDRELYEVITNLLSVIDDGHVGLEANLGGQDRWFGPPMNRRRPSSKALERAETDGFWTVGIGKELASSTYRSFSDGRIGYGMIGAETGYLYIGSSGSGLSRALAGPLDGARALFSKEKPKRVVIDLSDNWGGTDAAARQFVSQFASKPVIGYSKLAGDVPDDTPQEIAIEASDDPIFDGPLVVITNQATISAGEIMLMGFRALPNVTHIGMATRGSLSDILTKDLPNGWSVDLGNEIYLDHEGLLFEGTGIPPAIELPVYDRKNAPRAAADAALQLIDRLDDIVAEPGRTRDAAG